MRTAFILITILFRVVLVLAQPTQTIRGKVTNLSTQEPLPIAAVGLNTNTSISTFTDSNGHFIMENITVGRHDILVTCTGFEPAIAGAVTLGSAKETFLNIGLRPTATQLQEVVIKPTINK